MEGLRVVVPMKPLAQSKLRLAGVLSSPQRERLALWMLQQVLYAVRAAAAGETLVVGGDPAVATLCAEAGARWQPEVHPGLNPTLQAARADADADACAGLLFLPADLPELRAADIEAVIDAFGGRHTVLAPGRRGGTNAILTPPGYAFSYQLGEGSFRRHCATLAQAGVPWSGMNGPSAPAVPSIEADVDVPDDLTHLEATVADLWQQVGLMDRFLTPATLRK